jgi:hypothetical protein
VELIKTSLSWRRSCFNGI